MVPRGRFLTLSFGPCCPYTPAPERMEPRMQGSANLNLMIKAARKAGRSLVKEHRLFHNFSFKHGF